MANTASGKKRQQDLDVPQVLSRGGIDLDSLYSAIGHKHDSDYLKLIGGTLTGSLTLSGASSHLTVGGNVDISGTLKVNNNTVWHAGNDGGGSGLNADLVDGYHGQSLVQVFGFSSRSTTEGTDSGLSWDDLTTPGSYNGLSRANVGTNAPNPSDSDYMHPIVFRYITSNNITQFAIPYSSSSSIYFRHKYNDTWTSWKTVWTSGNDGSGSGLDADLLDGHHSSDFSLASHTHDDRYYTETEIDSLLSTKLDASAYTAADVFSKVLSQDGPGTGLDADTLDGYQASAFELAFTKNTAFNKNFAGTGAADTVARSDHNHDGVYSPTSHTHSVTIRIPHTYTIPGEIKVASGSDDYIPPFFVSLPTGQSAQIVGVKYVIESGTSVGFKLQINGTDSDTFQGITATTTAGTNFTGAETLSDGDKINLVVTSVAGTPKNLSVTIFIDYTKSVS